MREIRSGSYALYKNIILELNVISNGQCELISRNDTNNKYENFGFVKYSEKVCYLLVNKKDIKSAYYVYSFCTYKRYKFQISGYIEASNKIRIIHSVEAQIYFQDFARHGYDPYLDIDEDDLEEIWEERAPIEGFKFDVEPIHFIKRKEK